MFRKCMLVIALAAPSAIAAPKAITKAEAEKKALALFPGKVIEVEEERVGGDKVFSVEIRGKDGAREISIRIADGQVVANHASDDDDEDEREAHGD